LQGCRTRLPVPGRAAPLPVVYGANESYGYNPAWLKPVASSHTTAVDPPVDIDRGGWKGGRHPHLTYSVRRQNPDLKSSAILADEFHHKAAELAKYGRVLVLLDACHSGGVTGDGSALTSNANLLRSIIAASDVTC
jgi:hypothetical protein